MQTSLAIARRESYSPGAVSNRVFQQPANVDLKVKTEAISIRRVEVITGVERRRDWTDEQKLSIIAESSRDGVVISDVARRYGLRPQQLFNWRNEIRKREAARLMCGRTPAFAPLMIADDRPATAPIKAPLPAADAPLIDEAPRGVVDHLW